MLKRHYLTGVLVLLSLATGSAAASAAETGIKTPDSSTHAIAYRYDPHRQFIAYRYDPHRQFYGYRGLYDYAGPRESYGYYPGYDDRWDYFIGNGNGYY
jgi:hypothetical protein